MSEPHSHDWQLGSWRVSPALNRLSSEAGERSLEPRVMSALCTLLQAGTSPVADQQLLAEVWQGQIVSDASLYKVMGELRKALGDQDKPYRYVERITGKAYRLKIAGTPLSEATVSSPDAAIPDILSPDIAGSNDVIPAASSPGNLKQRSVLAAMLILLVGAMALAWFVFSGPPPHSETQHAARDAYQLGRWAWNQRKPERLEQAAREFQRAIELAPDLAEAYVGLCDTWHFQHLYADLRLDTALARCEPLLREALRRQPELPSALASFGLLRATQGDTAAAQAFLAKARAGAPEDANILLWQAEVQRRQGDLIGALASLRSAEQKDPLSAIIKRHLSYTLAQHGDLLAARASLSEALLLEPDYRNRPSDELETFPVNVERARAFLNWLNQNPGELDQGAPERDLARRINKALLHISLQETDQAAELLNTPALREHRHPYLLFARAALAIAQNDLSAAENHLRARMALQTEHAAFERPLFFLQVLQGQRAEARQRFLELFPKFADSAPAFDPQNLPLLSTWLYLAEAQERARWLPIFQAHRAELAALQSASAGIALIQAGDREGGEALLHEWLSAGGLPFPGEDFVMPEQHPVWRQLSPELLKKLQENRRAVRASASDQTKANANAQTKVR